MFPKTCFGTEEISGLLSMNVKVVKSLCNFWRVFTVITEAVLALSYSFKWPSRLLWLFDHNVYLPEWPAIKNNGLKCIT